MAHDRPENAVCAARLCRVRATLRCSVKHEEASCTFIIVLSAQVSLRLIFVLGHST